MAQRAPIQRNASAALDDDATPLSGEWQLLQSHRRRDLQPCQCCVHRGAHSSTTPWCDWSWHVLHRDRSAKAAVHACTHCLACMLRCAADHAEAILYSVRVSGQREAAPALVSLVLSFKAAAWKAINLWIGARVPNSSQRSGAQH